MLNHKEQMINSGWDVDITKGEKEVIYSGDTIDGEWSYDRLVYKK